MEMTNRTNRLQVGTLPVHRSLPSAGGKANFATAPTEPKSDDVKLKAACMDFEAIFLERMFQAMRQTLSGDSLLDGGAPQDMYESMYYQELAAQAARSQSLGIGAALYEQLRDPAGGADPSIAGTENR